MARLDAGNSGGGGSTDSASDSGPDTGREEPETDITEVDTNKDSTSISLGDADPTGPQKFDGTAGAEQPETPSTKGEAVITGGTNKERQKARDKVFSNESDRQKALAKDAEKKKETVKKTAKKAEGFLTAKSAVLGALASLTVIVAVLKGLIE